MGSSKPFWANSCFEWVVVIGFIVFLVVFITTFPECSHRHNRMEAECKTNLHSIQLALERYGVDHNHQYPQYLIGGGAEHASGYVDLFSGQTSSVTQVPQDAVSDPLSREGYLPRYPRNPFIRGSKDNRQLYELQEKLSTSITGDDPLRNGPGADGGLLGTRFGAKCDLMGQVLCDARAEKFSYVDPSGGNTITADSWAIVEYRAWDIWDGFRRDKTKQLLPGQFFYKAMSGGHKHMVGREEVLHAGPVGPDEQGASSANEHLSLEGDELRPLRCMSADRYIVGAYGGPRTKGKDVLGEETLGIWTRSTYSASRLDGSCYLAVEHEGFTEIQYGDPNGIRDGLILILTAGVEYLSGR